MTTLKRIPLLFVVLLAALGCGGWYNTPPAASTEQPAECQVVGTWQGMVPGGIMAGRVVTFVFQPDGTATGTVSTIQVNSNFTRTGELFEISDISGTPAVAACPPHQLGRYTLTFDGSCNTVEVVGADDECNHRRLTLAGLRAQRR